jgi:cyclopropane fatty-acyl-phospholipid synthase-like methyltransferase
MENAKWFVDWFNSPYYHLLYNNRNDQEANFFIDNLCHYLQLTPGARIWDIACGKGRHSVALSRKGFHVTGTDLSVNNITQASEQAGDGLEFFIHDMRLPFKVGYFDATFNLFTSIGYFENLHDNYAVFKQVALALKPGGLLVIDFLNATRVKRSLNPSYTEQRGDITFHIRKEIVHNTIVKHIRFSDQGRDYVFEESVSLLTRADFEKFAGEAGLGLSACFGNYQLRPFDEEQSERLILIFRK